MNPQPVILGAVKVMSVSERQKGEIMQREWRKLTGVLATLTYAQGRALKEELVAEDEGAAVIEAIEIKSKSVACPCRRLSYPERQCLRQSSQDTDAPIPWRLPQAPRFLSSLVPHP